MELDKIFIPSKESYSEGYDLTEDFYSYIKSIIGETSFSKWMRSEITYNKRSLSINNGILRLDERGDGKDLGLLIDFDKLHQTVYTAQEFEEFSVSFLEFLNALHKSPLPIKYISGDGNFVSRYLNTCIEAINYLLPLNPELFVEYSQDSFKIHLSFEVDFLFSIPKYLVKNFREPELKGNKLFIGDNLNTREEIRGLLYSLDLISEIEKYNLSILFAERKQYFANYLYKSLETFCGEKNLNINDCLNLLYDVSRISKKEILLNIESKNYVKKFHKDTRFQLTYFKIRDTLFVFSNESGEPKLIHSKTEKDFVKQFLMKFIEEQLVEKE